MSHHPDVETGTRWQKGFGGTPPTVVGEGPLVFRATTTTRIARSSTRGAPPLMSSFKSLSGVARRTSLASTDVSGELCVTQLLWLEIPIWSPSVARAWLQGWVRLPFGRPALTVPNRSWVGGIGCKRRISSVRQLGDRGYAKPVLVQGPCENPKTAWS